MRAVRKARSIAAAVVAAALGAASLTLLALPAQAVVGTAQADDSYAYTAQLTVGHYQHGCSAVLVDKYWLLTAASCFVDDPAASLTVPAGKPAQKTVATIGRTDLTSTSGDVRDVVELVPYPGRDVVLARLARPVLDVAPAKLGTTAPAAGDQLVVAGYGRSADEVSPTKLHTGGFSVDAVNGSDVQVTGQDNASVCSGDAGGPVVLLPTSTPTPTPTSTGPVIGGGPLPITDDRPPVVALNSRSYQVGCFAVDNPDGTPNSAVATRVDDLTSWIYQKIDAPRITDFNCDGIEDIAIADPEATVNGFAKAGLVRVVYGGGKGTVELNQDLTTIAGSAEAGDEFGEAIAVFDHNEDGCSDLVVGTPYDDLPGGADAGFADIIYGSPSGLTNGQASLHLEQGSGSGALLSMASKAGDQMGATLAAGQTSTGEPYLAIGIPGKDVGTATDAGSVVYLRGSVSVAISQNSSGLDDTAETGDHFGAAIAASEAVIAIGAPGEDLSITDAMGKVTGTATDTGAVTVLSHSLNADGIPTQLGFVSQDFKAFGPEENESGDQFGASLSTSTYYQYLVQPNGVKTQLNNAVIAVGVPGEDITVGSTSYADAGRVVLLTDRLNAISLGESIDQSPADVSGGPEAGDRFGAQVALADLPGDGINNLELAVGIPGEAIGTLAQAGAVQVFNTQGNPGDADYWLQEGSLGVPGTPAASHKMGSSIYGTGNALYVGMPYGPNSHGSLYAVPWSNVTGGTVAAVTTYAPGAGGLPAAGVRFGWAAR